jgi:hypothetical protein
MKKTILRSNTTIDGLRIFLVMAIVYIHCQPLLSSLVIQDAFLSFIYDKVVALAILALPIFFAVSGYFLYGAKDDPTRFRRLIRLLKILFWSEILYLLVSFIFGGVKVNLLPFFDIQNLTNLFTAASPIPIANGVSNLPLWYLVCLAIVSFVNWFAGKYREKVMLAMAIVGFLIGNLHGGYAAFAENSVIVPLLDRIFGSEFDFLTQGFLYISIGYFVRKYQSKIAEIPKWIFGIALPLSYILFLFEKQYITTNGFMIPVFTAATIAFSVVAPKIFSRKFRNLASLGAKYSLYMYIIHPIVIFLLNFVALPILAPANLLDMVVFWLTVLVCSLLISIGFVKTINVLSPKLSSIQKGLNGKVEKFLAE